MPDIRSRPLFLLAPLSILFASMLSAGTPPEDGQIRGRVTDATTGEPAEVVFFTLFGPDGERADPIARAVDEDGFYVFEEVPPGEYFLWVTARFYLAEVWRDQLCPARPGEICDPTQGTPIVVGPGEVVDGIDFTLERGGEITGNVHDAVTGEPIPLRNEDDAILLWSKEGDLVGVQQLFYGSGFRFDNLVPGRYVVTTLLGSDRLFVDEMWDDLPCPGGPRNVPYNLNPGPGGCDAVDGTPIEIGLGEVREADFGLLRPGGAILGAVRASGAPIDNVRLFLETPAGSRVATTRTRLDGTYSFAGVDPGEYVVFTRNGSPHYLDEIWDDVPCPDGRCAASLGTPILVEEGAATDGINFELEGVVGDPGNPGEPVPPVGVRKPTPDAPAGQWIGVGPDGGAFSVGVDPWNPEILHAGSIGGYYRSEDGGETWVWSSRGLGCCVRQLFAFPEGRRTALLVYGLRGVFRSTNRGRSWARVLDHGNIDNLVRAPSRPQRFFADVNGQGLWRSDDRGVTWQRIGHQGPRRLRSSIWSLAVDPLDADRLYASSSEGLHRSLDGGETWVTLETVDPDSNVLRIAVGPPVDASGVGLVLLTNFLRPLASSSDGGETFTLLPEAGGPAFNRVEDVWADPHRGGVFYGVFGLEGRIRQAAWRSDDGGFTWSPIDGLAGLRVESFTFVGDRPELVLSAHSGGVGRSEDAGQTWASSASGFDPSGLTGVALHPTDPEVLHLHGFLPTFVSSFDEGVTWAQSNPEEIGLFWTLVRDPYAPEVLWLGTDEGLFRSLDEGVSWEPRNEVGDDVPQRLVISVLANPWAPGELFVGTLRGLFRHNGRAAEPIWEEVHLPGEREERRVRIHRLAAHPEGRSLWALGDRTVYRSTNGGATWEQLPLDLPRETLTSIVFDPLRPERVYLGGTRLRRSLDGGETWELWEDGIPALRTVEALAIDPGTGAVYAGLSKRRDIAGGRVYRRGADGPTWNAIGRLRENVESLVVERRGKAVVWVMTRARGLFRLVRSR